MYKLACKDLGAPECDYIAQGETQEETLNQMKMHAMQAHPEKMEEMKDMPEEDVNKMMIGKMTEESAV